jgi:predicted ATPase/Tfp pilus assembly protein PilF
MITGRLPFVAENELAVLFQHIRDTPPLPSSFVLDLPEGIEYITLKALAKQPGDRYQTMESMLADLENPENLVGQITKILPYLEAHSLPPHYIPALPTLFIQRKEELDAVQTRLTQSGTRLLTLVGVGGVGKTRLALEAGKNLLHTFPDGVFFLDLTAVQRPNLLPGMIAHLVNMAEEGQESIKEQLLAYLSQRQLLLIMDNFEHILEAAPLVSEILAAAPQCKVLATSREPLRLYGENLLQITPLPLPDLQQQITYDELSQFTAVQLFADRARAITADFVLTQDNIQIIAQLCVQLDGLPLALELAAGQSYAYTLSEIAAQLKDRLAFLTDGPRDRSTRQQTMRGALDWSYNLLSQAEQKAFSQLSIFVGRFSQEAATEIIGPVNLQTIVQKSLLQHEEGHNNQPRFWMLQVIREYAYEKLKADQAFEALQQKHTTFYVELAKTAELHLTSPRQKDWFALLEAEHDNFRAVLARCLEDNAPETALQLSGILWRLWAVYSYLSEGTLWAEAILNQTSHLRNILRAKLLFGAGRLALFQQKLAAASQRFNESLEIYRELQARPAQANLLNSLGEIALHHADYDQANQLFQEALDLFQAEDDKTGISQTLTHLGQLAFNQQQYEIANNFLLQSLELGEVAGTPETIAIVLNGLGEIARMQKRNPEASAYYERSLDIYRQLNYGIGQAAMLHNLGQVRLAQKQFQEAAALFRQSLSLLTTMEEKVFIGWNLAGLGAALLNLGNAKHAVRLFSASQAIFERFGGQLDTADQAVYDRYLAASKMELTDKEWQQAWIEGQNMPVENELLNVIALTPMLPREESD